MRLAGVFLLQIIDPVTVIWQKLTLSISCVSVTAKVVISAKQINVGSHVEWVSQVWWFPRWYRWGWESLCSTLGFCGGFHPDHCSLKKMQHPNVEQEVRKNSSELGSLKRSELCLIGLLWAVTYFKLFSQGFLNIFSTTHVAGNCLWHYQVSLLHISIHNYVKSFFHTITEVCFKT